MKIVMLKGSPHEHGASNTLAGFFAKGARDAGHDVVGLDVAHMDIRPCLGCPYSSNAKPCAIRDDMEIVRGELEDAGMIVYVTPVYYYGMTAPLKMVIDRLHCFNGYLSGKYVKSALVATAWRTDGEVMRYLDDYYNGLTRYLGYDSVGTVLSRGCANPDLIRQSPDAERAYTLGRSL